MEGLISDYRFFIFVICGNESIGTPQIVGGLVLTNTNKDNSYRSHLCFHSDCDSRYQQPGDERPGKKRSSRTMITMCALRSVLEIKWVELQRFGSGKMHVVSFWTIKNNTFISFGVILGFCISNRKRKKMKSWFHDYLYQK